MTEKLTQSRLQHKKLQQYWVEWKTELSQEDNSLECYEFKVIEDTIDFADSQYCVPLIWLEELIGRYGALNILRTPYHRPKDPYELVDFIQYLERFDGRTS